MLKGNSPYGGMTMKKIVASRLTQTPILDPKESARNQNIAANMRTKSFMGNIVTRFVLPHDGATDDSIRKAQASRQNEFMRQAVMPWGNSFMSTATDQARLNNNAQASFVRQRQLTIPSSYGSFYAFMHALSAAFGNLNQNG